MPIKWSAIEVSESMDEVAFQVGLAEPFLTEARAKAVAAREIANLPQYVDQHLVRLLIDIDRLDNVKRAIEAVRDAVPDGAAEAEQDRIRHGGQRSLIQ